VCSENTSTTGCGEKYFLCGEKYFLCGEKYFSVPKNTSSTVCAENIEYQLVKYSVCRRAVCAEKYFYYKVWQGKKFVCRKCVQCVPENTSSTFVCRKVCVCLKVCVYSVCRKKYLQCVLKILNSINWKNTISYNGKLRLGKANDNTIEGQQKYRIGVRAVGKTTNQT